MSATSENSHYEIEPAVKYSLTLMIALAAVWLLWSGHFENGFLLVLGGLSVLICLFLSNRMRIVDSEGAPVQLGFRPFTSYAPWLIKEIIVSNIAVAKIILSIKMPLKRNLVEVTAKTKTELGRVILANSITLTPGTVAVGMEDDKIAVHALSFEGSAEDLSGDMDRRICKLEGDQ
jgi:multicomponent Na+:H+ antiporter subunit E